jgi:hypothetical protein
VAICACLVDDEDPCYELLIRPQDLSTCAVNYSFKDQKVVSAAGNQRNVRVSSASWINSEVRKMKMKIMIVMMMLMKCTESQNDHTISWDN